MEKTLILGNKPEKWWIKDLGETDVLSVPNFSVGKNSDISNFVRELPKDIDCVVIDADSLYTENIELPLDLALQIRLMLRECLHTSLSSIIIVSDLSIEAFRELLRQHMPKYRTQHDFTDIFYRFCIPAVIFRQRCAHILMR